MTGLPVTTPEGRLVGLLTLSDTEHALARLGGSSGEASTPSREASNPS